MKREEKARLDSLWNKYNKKVKWWKALIPFYGLIKEYKAEKELYKEIAENVDRREISYDAVAERFGEKKASKIMRKFGKKEERYKNIEDLVEGCYKIPKKEEIVEKVFELSGLLEEINKLYEDIDLINLANSSPCRYEKDDLLTEIKREIDPYCAQVNGELEIKRENKPIIKEKVRECIYREIYKIADCLTENKENILELAKNQYFNKLLEECIDEVTKNVNLGIDEEEKKRIEYGRKIGIRNRVLFEALKEYDKFNQDIEKIIEELKIKLFGQNGGMQPLPTYEVGKEEIIGKAYAIRREEIERIVSSENFKKENKESIKNEIKRKVVMPVVEDYLKKKRNLVEKYFEDTRIDEREAIKAFINYLEKKGSNPLELWMDFDCLEWEKEPTRFLKRVLAAYTKIKESSDVKYDREAIVDRVLHDVRINYMISENGKDELRKDLNSALRYLILMLQSERNDLKKEWNKIKTKFDVPLNPLFSPKYGDLEFYRAVQEYRISKLYGEPVSLPMIFD